ncbi:5944_t:CDS:1, partial [Ambispora leptoticha]
TATTTTECSKHQHIYSFTTSSLLNHTNLYTNLPNDTGIVLQTLYNRDNWPLPKEFT